MTKLKLYKSCAYCSAYEVDIKNQTYCNLGFPLCLLEEVKTIKTIIGDPYNSMSIYHKPKYGCPQKQYPGSKKIDHNELIRIATEITDKFE